MKVRFTININIYPFTTCQHHLSHDLVIIAMWGGEGNKFEDAQADHDLNGALSPKIDQAQRRKTTLQAKRGQVHGHYYLG